MSTRNMALSLANVVNSAGIILSFFMCMAYAHTKERFQPHNIRVSDPFMVKPGGSEHTYSDTWDDFTCSFTYVAQGGTHEEWTMSFTRSEDKRQVECIVERPDGTSYLYFQKFQLQIGKEYKLVEALAHKRDTGPDDSMIVVDKEARTVKNNDAYQGYLSKLEAYGVKGHEEL